ncbi:MAG TPA: aspartate-semialdehyde dehydrogenase [Armatimonadota bacterium]|nr:aspartate-semialdehyde dehydrogenase [Armatimonadota bacterium]
MERCNVAVVGAGAVGEEMLNVLAQRDFPIRELKVLARSAREIVVGGRSYDVRQTVPEEFDGVDIMLFAGTEGASKLFAWEAAGRGAVVIDNSSTYRMDPRVPLVVPECNPDDVSWHQGVIANPNCSTIQMVVALKPLYDRSRISRIVVSTYQAVSGTGRDAIKELEDQSDLIMRGEDVKAGPVYPYQIGFNLFPHIGTFREDGYTAEEWKMVEETHKILGDEGIKIVPTTVRVPVFISHSESVYIETEKKISADEARELLAKAPGVVVVDDPDPREGDGCRRTYPMPIDASGRDEVFVGRIRGDPFVPTGLSMWIVSDNLRKGAALNAVQIAELLVSRGMLKGRKS